MTYDVPRPLLEPPSPLVEFNQVGVVLCYVGVAYTNLVSFFSSLRDNWIVQSIDCQSLLHIDQTLRVWERNFEERGRDFVQAHFTKNFFNSL